MQDNKNLFEDQKEKIDNYKEELKESYKNAIKAEDIDDIFDRHIHRPLGMLIALPCAKRKISPNVITMFSILVGVCGGALMYPRNLALNILGVLLHILSGILDCADGQIARLAHNGSEFGRFLDGVADGICFLAVYVALSLRMMPENIPFTNVKWGLWIWLVAIVCGAICHAGQARMGDYFRTVHLFFEKGSEIDRSSDLEKVYQEKKSSGKLWERAWTFGYLNYTKAQEKATPKHQALIKAIEENNGIVPEGAGEAYVLASRKYVQVTNMMTFGWRAYILYILLIVGLYPFYMPFIIIGYEIIKAYMVNRYENIAQSVKDTYFGK